MNKRGKIMKLAATRWKREWRRWQVIRSEVDNEFESHRVANLTRVIFSHLFEIRYVNLFIRRIPCLTGRRKNGPRKLKSFALE